MNTSSASSANTNRSSADRLLVLLKTRGPHTTAELGKATGLTGEAVRQQLAKLSREGLVVAVAASRGIGRPAHVWTLTDAAHTRFPDGHAEVAAQLIRTIRTQLGAEALDRLIDARAAEAKAVYAAALEGSNGLGERVARLAEARTREGYMAEWRPDGGDYVLIENHCPVCAAATACQGFCRAELETFHDVLGPGVSVERTEHIVAGDRRCAYRIAREEAPSGPARP